MILGVGSDYHLCVYVCVCPGSSDREVAMQGTRMRACCEGACRGTLCMLSMLLGPTLSTLPCFNPVPCVQLLHSVSVGFGISGNSITSVCCVVKCHYQHAYSTNFMSCKPPLFRPSLKNCPAQISTQQGQALRGTSTAISAACQGFAEARNQLLIAQAHVPALCITRTA
jgi:hypothetical protein